MKSYKLISNFEAMKKAKKIGIWMDYSVAHLMGFIDEAIDLETIELELKQQLKENSLFKGEKIMYDKDLLYKREYYKNISEVILNYNEVILFGPTSAKTELFNNLSDDDRFENINFIIMQTDKMNNTQRLTFVNDYFQ